MTAADDILTQVDAELADAGVVGEAPTADDVAAMEASIFENLPGIDRIEFVEEATGETTTVLQRPVQLGEYDAIGGYVPRDPEPEAAPESEVELTDEEIRARWIDEQLGLGETAAHREASEQALEIEREEARARIKAEAVAQAEKVRAYMGEFLVLPVKYRDAYLDLMTVWSIHTYAYRRQGKTPYLAVVAPTQGSGKTTLAEVLSTLAHNPSGIEVNPTSPVVRTLANTEHTVFLDEVDTLASDNTFVAVLNSGYRAGGAVSRISRKGGEDGTTQSHTFCPKVICGIAAEGRLNLPSPTLDRCIDIRIMRAKPGELTKRFRVDIMRGESHVEAMRQWMERWVAANYGELRDAYFELPELSTSRAGEIWEPLITIAGLLGGGWYERLCNAALLLDDARTQNIDPNVALIQDVATVVTAFFDAIPDATQIKVDDLDSLRNVLLGRKLDRKLTAEQMVRRIGAFGIKPEKVVQDGVEVLVYTVRTEDGEMFPDWQDLFERYNQ